MSRNWLAVLIIPFVSLVLVSRSFAKDESTAEPGPESGGLRLRFTVRSLPRSGEEAFDVRLDLINTTENKITLQTGWESTEPGEVKEYLAAAASIESTPRSARPRGATGLLAARTEPQKQHALGPQETLTLQWQTAGRFLKGEAQQSRLLAANPLFTQPGLYSVHVNLDVITTSGTYRLRSNEQLVSIGGSRRQPKATAGEIRNVSRDRTTAEINLGKHDQVAIGDRFDLTSKVFHWRVTITDVGQSSSQGTLELLSSQGDATPTRGDEAILIEQISERK